jgi:adhesin/invasin
LSTASSVPWLAASIGTAHSCSLKGNCIPVQITLQTSSLAKGTYTGTVTVSDPNAVNSPQFVTVTALVGGNVPDKLEYFVAPNGSTSSTFTTVGPVTATVGSNAPWLAIASDGMGSFQFGVPVPYRVTATAQNGMATGDYNGSIAISGSSFAPDNKPVPVVLHVTTQPILAVNPPAISFRIAQSANKQTAFVVTANGGQGTLTISSVTATPSSGAWLSAQTVSSNPALVSIVADPSGLSPNTYQGTVTIASNAVNSSVVIPVQLNVVGPTAPVVAAGGVVNNGTFGGGESLAQGDIAALFGDQLTYGDAQQATGLPLTTILGGTQVLVNGQAAPVYYVSPSQINFEIPIDAATSDGTVQVVRNGQAGNMAYLNIKDRVPRFITNGGAYAIMTTPDGTLTGIPTHPVKPDDVVVIYMIGLGPTTPVVPSGTASPGNPLAVIDLTTTQACFGVPSPFSPTPCITPQFVGLTPGFVGLYQVNLAIPDGLTSGNVPFSFSVSGVNSNVVQLAVQ